MSSRERILERIRKAQGRGGSKPSRAELEAVETYLRAHPRGTPPKVEGDLVARFRARAGSMQSTTEEVAAKAEVPAAVARYLRLSDLPLAGCVWPQLAGLAWPGAGLAFEPRAANAGMLASGPDTPSTVSLLPETHVAVVSAGRIVAHMEDAWSLARDELRQLPRAVNFVSGPSRTADIDQTIVLGAHGPYRVHIVLVRT